MTWLTRERWKVAGDVAVLAALVVAVIATLAVVGWIVLLAVTR